MSNVHNILSRGSSSNRTRTNKIIIYEDLLFKREEFPYLVMCPCHILLYSVVPFQLSTTEYGAPAGYMSYPPGIEGCQMKISSVDRVALATHVKEVGTPVLATSSIRPDW